jgi:hypothetical protein
MYIRLIPHYLLWHYTAGLHDYARVAKRFLSAVTSIFSLKLLFRTFFQPFERLGEHYHGGGPSAYFEIFIVNTLMRMVGMLVRSCVIVIGLISWVLACVFCVAGFGVWLVAPAIPVILVYIAVHNLVKAV